MTTGFVLWIPFHIWHLIQIPGINVDARTCFTIRDVTFCVAFMNSALNPIFTTFFLTKTAQVKNVDYFITSSSTAKLYHILETKAISLAQNFIAIQNKIIDRKFVTSPVSWF